MTEEES